MPAQSQRLCGLEWWAASCKSLLRAGVRRWGERAVCCLKVGVVAQMTQVSIPYTIVNQRGDMKLKIEW